MPSKSLYIKFFCFSKTKRYTDLKHEQRKMSNYLITQQRKIRESKKSERSGLFPSPINGFSFVFPLTLDFLCFIRKLPSKI